MSIPHIESYHFGRIEIDGRSHSRDLIILPSWVLCGWRRKEGHLVQPEDLEAVFTAMPELLIIGQGAHSQMQVTPESKRALQSAGIELLLLPTKEACQRYNRLRKKRAVAAALHLTG